MTGTEPAPEIPTMNTSIDTVLDSNTTTQRISWREVPLYWLGAQRALTDAERVTALAEYRATGGMVDVVMCDPSDYGSEPEEADAMTYEGPSVAEIDWAGLEAITP